MIDFTRKVTESPAVQDILSGAMGVTMTAVGGAGLTARINLANSLLSICSLAVGIILIVVTIAKMYYTAKKERIMAKQYQFDYEQSVKYSGDDRRKD